jgi:REP element-mobilizing transposase RayT
MNKRDHLRRLEPENYRGDAVVHWTLTTRERRTGWLDVRFYYRFRELLTHSAFRYGFVCPIFCLMPDHIHMVWMGLFEQSDQLYAMKHFRKSVNESLRRIDHELQDQPFDQVLRDEERRSEGLQTLCNYIARNPERAGLVADDKYATYPYTGCLIPGYPSLRPFELTFWDEFDRTVSFLRREGLFRKPKT